MRQVRAQNDGYIVHEQKRQNSPLLQVRGRFKRHLRQADNSPAVYWGRNCLRHCRQRHGAKPARRFDGRFYWYGRGRNLYVDTRGAQRQRDKAAWKFSRGQPKGDKQPYASVNARQNRRHDFSANWKVREREQGTERHHRERKGVANQLHLCGHSQMAVTFQNAGLFQDEKPQRPNRRVCLQNIALWR